MSAELMLRAKQLGSGAERTRLAEAVDGVLREAREPARMTRLLRRRRVQACAGELHALARRLRDDQPIALRGVAMTALLLSDGGGPLYYERASVPLGQAVQSARRALDQAGPDAARILPGRGLNRGESLPARHRQILGLRSPFGTGKNSAARGANCSDRAEKDTALR